jgi:hypothetical protein
MNKLFPKAKGKKEPLPKLAGKKEDTKSDKK